MPPVDGCYDHGAYRFNHQYTYSQGVRLTGGYTFDAYFNGCHEARTQYRWYVVCYDNAGRFVGHAYYMGFPGHPAVIVESIVNHYVYVRNFAISLKLSSKVNPRRERNV